jgi:hypothetical protein
MDAGILRGIRGDPSSPVTLRWMVSSSLMVELYDDKTRLPHKVVATVSRLEKQFR